MPVTYNSWLAAGQPGGSFYDYARSNYSDPYHPAATTTASTSGGGLPNYNVTPSPTGGQGPYGLVPGTIGVPPSTFQQFSTAFPGLSGAPGQISSNIMSELQGEISPQALRNMQDTAARFAVSSGMPGSNAIPGSLANNSNLLENILTTQQIQHQGQQDYLGTLGGVGAQQTNPNLAAQIAEANAQLKAAPDPTAAAQQQLANYYAALQAARGPGGGSGGSPGPSGGTGAYSPVGVPGGTPALGGGVPGTGLPNYGTDFSYSTPGGSSLSWAGVDTSGLFNDLGAGSGSSDYTQAYSNPEDYYASILAGG